MRTRDVFLVHYVCVSRVGCVCALHHWLVYGSGAWKNSIFVCVVCVCVYECVGARGRMMQVSIRFYRSANTPEFAVRQDLLCVRFN